MSHSHQAPARPAVTEYAPFYEPYIARVPEDDVLLVLHAHVDEVRAALARVSQEGEQFAYAPGKWTVREVLGHMLDVERVFAHRALCIGRADPAPLPGFEEGLYVAESGAGACPLPDLVEEFVVTRSANLAMLRRLPDGAWRRQGVANGHVVSVRALAFMMAGHVRHHLALLSERYGLV
jgi:hypothetical protein